jgi:hypothetical protein
MSSDRRRPPPAPAARDSAGRRARAPILLPLGAALALAWAADAGAAIVPVTVRITSVTNISAGDVFGGMPDFFVRINIDGAWFQTTTAFDVGPTIPAPASWVATRNISRTARSSLVPIRIELWDQDDPFGNAAVDIDPATCVGSFNFGCAVLTVGRPAVDTYGIDISLNPDDGSWMPVDPSGDSSSPGPATVCTSGTEGAAATICFSISLGTPINEALTVTTTADSNRARCVPGDCSLREAVTVADPGDTVILPASATPYDLTLDARLFEPIDPNRGSHLAVVSPLTIIGPLHGGTAVIRQTRPDSRVFDVHSSGQLGLRNVTLTGGGAGQNSTALPSHIHGAGIHNHGLIVLTNVTITGNRATFSGSRQVGGGGGIYNAGGAVAHLDGVTISENVSSRTDANDPLGAGVPMGGGIAGPGTFYLRNTVISGNTLVDGSSSNCGLAVGMSFVDQGGNLQFPGNDCGRWVTFQSPRGGIAHTFWWPYFPTAGANPLSALDPQRWVYPPAADAVDGGTTGCGPVDQIGHAAPVDGNGDGSAACDAGAIELPPSGQL